MSHKTAATMYYAICGTFRLCACEWNVWAPKHRSTGEEDDGEEEKEEKKGKAVQVAKNVSENFDFGFFRPFASLHVKRWEVYHLRLSMLAFFIFFFIYSFQLRTISGKCARHEPAHTHTHTHTIATCHATRHFRNRRTNKTRQVASWIVICELLRVDGTRKQQAYYAAHSHHEI